MSSLFDKHNSEIPPIQRDALLPLSTNTGLPNNNNNNGVYNANNPNNIRSVDSVDAADYNALVQQNTELQSHNQFLQSYIVQCEAQLQRYQQLHPDVVVNTNIALSTLSTDDIPPWLNNSKLMSPLLIAYESRLNELTAVNTKLASEHSVLQSQVEQLLARNESMEHELELNIKQLMQQLDTVTPADTQAAGVDSTTVSLLQQQVEQLRQVEVQLKHELNTCKLQYDNQLDTVQQQYNKSITTLKTENLTLLQHVEAAKRVEKQLQQSKAELNTLKQQYTTQHQQLLEIQARCDAATRLSDTLSQKFIAQQQHTDSVSAELQRCISALTISEQTANKYKDNELVIMKQINDNTDQLTAALNERDAALAQLQTKELQISNLRVKLQQQAADSKQHEEQQLSALYASSKDTENKLLSELKALELQCIEFELTRDQATKQLQLETAQYNKQLKQLDDNNERLKHDITVLQNKCAELQSHSTVYSGETQRLNTELQRKLDITAKQKQLYNDQYNDLKTQYDILDQKYYTLNAQHTALQQQVDTVTAESTKLKRSNAAVVQRYELRLSDLDAQHALEVKDYKHKLIELQQQQSHKEQKLSALLEQHVHLADKYKNENSDNLQYFTKTIAEYRDKYTQLQAVHSTVDAQLIELQHRYDTLAQQYHTMEQQYAELHAQYSSAQQTLHSTIQENDELSRSNIQLQTRVDKLNIENERLRRTNESQHRKQLSGLQDTKLPLPDVTNFYKQPVAT